MHSLNTLQFNQLLDLIVANTQTPMGERRFKSLRPLTSRLELERDLRAIKETISLAAGDQESDKTKAFDSKLIL